MNVPETFFTIEEELRLFLLSCAAGAVFGVYYDIFRALRLTVPHHSFFVFLEDLLFLMTYGIFLSCFASAEARGVLRGYYILGGFIGFVLYYFTIGKFVMGFIKKLIKCVRKMLSVLYKPIGEIMNKIVRINVNAVKSNKKTTPPLQNND